MKNYKVVLRDKVFNREMETVKTGSLQDCLKELDNRKLYCLVDKDHYETRDYNFLVAIEKDESKN